MAVFATNFAFDFSYLTSVDRYDGPDSVTGTAATFSGSAALTKGGTKYAFTDVWTGTGISLSPLAGTFTAYSQTVSGVGTATATGLSLVASQLAPALDEGSKATWELVCASADSFTGSSYNDVLWSFAGNDTIDGGAGNDNMVGGSGDDTYYVDSTGDRVTEKANQGTDTIISTVSSHTLGKEFENLTFGTNAVTGIGNKSNNTITGNSSDNTLYGKEGNDILTGGSGSDTFVFDSRLSASTNLDTITDFVSGVDHIGLSAKIFAAYKSTAAGTQIAAADVVSGAGVSALDSSDHFLYDTTTGALYYDVDGSGKKAAVQFATLTGVPALSASDLLIV